MVLSYFVMMSFRVLIGFVPRTVDMEERIAETKPVQQGLIFINNSSPEDARSKPKRKAVRSHAARYQSHLDNQDKSPRTITKQHRYRRRQDAQNLSFALEMDSLVPSVQAVPSMQAEPSRGSLETRDPNQSVARTESSRPSMRQRPELGSQTAQPSGSQDHSLQGHKTPLVPRQTFRSWVLPFVAFPVPWKPFVPAVIDHCESNFVYQNLVSEEITVLGSQEEMSLLFKHLIQISQGWLSTSRN